MPAPEGKLTPVQYEIMELIWHAPPPGTTVGELYKALGPRRDVTRTTVQNLVERLEKRRWLVRKKGDGGYRYQAALEREPATRALAEEFVDEFFSGSASDLVMSLLGSKRLKPEDLQRLRDQLDVRMSQQAGKSKTKPGGR